jgi:hypothetical protein
LKQMSYLFDKFDQEEHATDLEAKRLGVRLTDPQSSVDAAEAIEASGKAGTQRRACLAVVRETPGLTAPEIAIRAGMDRYAASRRLPELRDQHRLVRNGPLRACSIHGTRMTTWEPVRVEE